MTALENTTGPGPAADAQRAARSDRRAQPGPHHPAADRPRLAHPVDRPLRHLVPAEQRHAGHRLVGPLVLDPNFTVANYERVISAEGMGEAFINSLWITIPSTILPLVIASMAAYALAWVKFPFRDTTFLIIVALLMVPVQIGFIPLVVAMRASRATGC